LKRERALRISFSPAQDRHERSLGTPRTDREIEARGLRGLVLRRRLLRRVDIEGRRAGDHLRDGGRIVTGFGAGRDYDFDDFRADVAAAGLTTSVELASWDLRPLTSDSDFLVAVRKVV